MKFITTLLLFICFHQIAESARSRSDDFYNVTQLIQEWGYPVENHLATTSDGYLLSIQRIPTRSGASRGPVMLQHGLLDTTATWVINSPSESLGFLLSDAGYDVWLVNVRGNRYSPVNDNPSFWLWNWDQHGQYDIPAAVDYILSKSGYSKLSLVAHSQGATTSIVALSTIPSLSSKVKVFVALAPVTYMANQQSPMLRLLANLHADAILKLDQRSPFMLTPGLLAKLFGSACKVTPDLCNNLLSSLFGPTHNLNSSRMAAYTSHWPDRTSTQNMIHWIQNARSGNFAAFDNAYQYNPSLVSVPTALFYGTSDFLADNADIMTLGNKLKCFFTKRIESFAHMDFVWSYLAKSNVYEDVLNILSKYE